MQKLRQGRQRHAGGDRQAVAERAGGQFDARNGLGDVAGEGAAIGCVVIEVGQREEAGFGQSGIDDGGGVALADDQPVTRGPIGAVRINPQDAAVEHRENVGDR